MEGKIKLNISIGLALLGVLVFIDSLPILDIQAQNVGRDFALGNLEDLSDKLITFQDNTLVPISTPPSSDIKVIKRIRVIVTAYSSTPWQTAGNPFITASGVRVREGIVANNLLPFGTQIRLPEIFGDKILIVADRMHRRKGYYHIDVWRPSYEEAKNFGVKRTYMEVVGHTSED